MSGVPGVAAMPPGAPARDHMPCLDGLRGLAATVVLLGHASDFGLPSILDGHARDCGVLIFFALSGFLMGDLYLVTSPTRARIESYIAARIARIVPIYYLVVLASFAIDRVDPNFVYAMTPTQLLRLLTFNGSIAVFWSIGPEVQFYAVFVALWLLHGRLQRDGMFALLVLGLGALCLATLYRWPGVFVASKFHIFALGMLAAMLRRHLVRRLPSTALVIGHAIALALLIVLLAPGLADTLIGPTPFDQQVDPAFTTFYGSLPRVVIAAALAFAFSFETRLSSILLANPLAVLLGRCSFSIYLLHVAVYDGAMRAGLTAALPGSAATLAVLIASVALSFVSYRAIEAPLRRSVRDGLLRVARAGDLLQQGRLEA